jgi:hypothetical protein
VVNGFEKTAALIFVNSHACADGLRSFPLCKSILLLLLFVSFRVFRGRISEAKDDEVNESDNTETEEERVRLKIADLD